MLLLISCENKQLSNAKADVQKQEKANDSVNTNDYRVYDSPNYCTQDFSNSNQLLKDLFHSHCFDSQGNIMWDFPSLDYFEIPRSYDDKIHTGIDTIMYFKDQIGDSCAVLILANYKMNRQNNKIYADDSHGSGLSLGVALFSKVKEGWKLYNFKKHITELGEWGTYKKGKTNDGKIYLKKLSNNWTCLSFKQGLIGNTGSFHATETFYTIERHEPEIKVKDIEYNEEAEEINRFEYNILSKLFTFEYLTSQYNPDPDIETITEKEATLSLIPSNNPLKDLIVNVKIINYDMNSSKLIYTKKLKRKFYYSDRLKIYLEDN